MLPRICPSAPFAVGLSALLFAPSASAFDPHGGNLTRDNPAYVRVLTYNALNQYPDGSPTQTAAYERILTAVQPDLIAFQELTPGVGPALKTRLDTVLGGNWQVHTGQSDGFNVNAVASRWGQSQLRTDTFPASGPRGTTLALIDLPSDRSALADFYVAGIHFKCCSGTSEDAQRQQHADAVAAWFGDARQPGGFISLPSQTPMLVVGDFNFINGGATQPRLTLLQGSIQNTLTYGPPVPGDWDGSGLAEALPLDPINLDFRTYSSSSPGSHLDRFYYTDSVTTVVQSLILNTATLPPTALTALGLQATDTAIASDHLPVVVDFAMGSTVISEPLYRQVFVTEWMADPTLVSDSNGEWFELYNASDRTVDLNGWVLRDGGSNFHVIRRAGGFPIAPRSHVVLGVNSNPATNGGVAVDYQTTNFFLGNTQDGIEAYRGSIKVDGIRYGSGSPLGLVPENTSSGSAPVAGRSRMMVGDYRWGSTGQWADSEAFYNAQDRGTPGVLNFPASTPAQDWQSYEP